MITPMNPRIWLFFGASSCLMAVIAGALGSHTIVMSQSGHETFKTAADYQMWHGLALVAVGLWQKHMPVRGLQIAGWLFLLGTMMFCIPLYLIGITDVRSFAPLAPIGGTFLIGGWLALAASALISRPD